MGDSRGIMQVRSKRQVPVRVMLLDDELFEDFVDKRAVGFILFDKVCERLNLLEKDYFGLTYRDPAGIKFWLNNEKKIAKQLKGGNWEFTFEVKFYSPDPAQLAEDITRYQLCLQIRRDIVNEKLPCSFLTYTLLGSYTAQSEMGDYDTEEFGSGYKYLKDMKFAPHQDKELLQKIAELHRQHKGQTPEEAELHFLENAVRLSMYGVELHAAKDAEGSDISLGVCAQGLIVYKDSQQMNRFVWPKVLKISYRRNKYFIKIRPGEFEEFASLIGFKLLNVKMAKRLWKISVEHHSFFRFREAEMPKQAGLMPRFGSRFRYSGRTMFQTRQVAAMENRDGVAFDRVMSKRGTFAGRTQNMRKRDEDRRDRRDEMKRQPVSPDSKPPPASDRPREDRKPSPPEPSYPPPELKHAPPVAPKPTKPKPSPREPSSENASLDRSFDSFEDVPDRRSKMEKMHAVATPLAAIMQKSIDKEAERDHDRDRYREEEEDRYRQQVGNTEPATSVESQNIVSREIRCSGPQPTIRGRRFRESMRNSNTQGAQRNIPSHDVTRSRDAYSYQSSSVDSMLSTDFDDYDGETGLIENRAMSVDALHVGSGHKSTIYHDLSSSQSSDDLSLSSHQSYHASNLPYKSSEGLYAEIDEVKKEIHKQYGRRGKSKERHRSSDAIEQRPGPSSQLRERHRSSDTIEQRPGPSSQFREKHISSDTIEQTRGPTRQQSRQKHRSGDTTEQTPEPSIKKSKSWFSLKQKFFSKNKESKYQQSQDKLSKPNQLSKSRDSKHQQSLQAPTKTDQFSRSKNTSLSQSQDRHMNTEQFSRSRDSKTRQSQDMHLKADQTQSSRKSQREKIKQYDTAEPTPIHLSKQTPTYAQINKTRHEKNHVHSKEDHQFETDKKKQNQSVNEDTLELDESNTGSLREELKMYILNPDKMNSLEAKSENARHRDDKPFDIKHSSDKKHKCRQNVEDLGNTANSRFGSRQAESKDLNELAQGPVAGPSNSRNISGVVKHEPSRAHRRNSMDEMEPVYKEIPDKVRGQISGVKHEPSRAHRRNSMDAMEPLYKEIPDKVSVDLDMLTPHGEGTDTLEKSLADSALTASQVSLYDSSLHSNYDMTGEKKVMGEKSEHVPQTDSQNPDPGAGDRVVDNKDDLRSEDQVKHRTTTTALDDEQPDEMFENHTYENLPVRKPFTLVADNQISSYDSSQDLIQQVDKQFDATMLKKLEADESDPISLSNVSSDSACNLSLDGDKSDISLHVTQHPGENIGSGSTSSLYQIVFDGSSVGSPEDSMNVSYSNSFVSLGVGDLSRNDQLVVDDNDLEKFSTVSSGSSEIETWHPASSSSYVDTLEKQSGSGHISIGNTQDTGKELSQDEIESNEHTLSRAEQTNDTSKAESSCTHESLVTKDDVDASMSHPDNQGPKASKSEETTLETTFSDAPSLIETNRKSEVINKPLASTHGKSMDEDSNQRRKDRRMLVKERAFQVDDYDDEPFKRRMPPRAYTEDSHKSKSHAETDQIDSFKSPRGINKNVQASLPTSKNHQTDDNSISKSLTEDKQASSKKESPVSQELNESRDKEDLTTLSENRPIDRRGNETSSDEHSRDPKSRSVKPKSEKLEATAVKPVSVDTSFRESKTDSTDGPKPSSKDPHWYKTHLLPSKQPSQKDIASNVTTQNGTKPEGEVPNKEKNQDKYKPVTKASKAAAAVAAAYRTTDRPSKPQRKQDTDSCNGGKHQDKNNQRHDASKNTSMKESKALRSSKPHVKQESDEPKLKTPHVLQKSNTSSKLSTKQTTEKHVSGKPQVQQDSDRDSSDTSMTKRQSEKHNKGETKAKLDDTSKRTSSAPHTVLTQYNQSTNSSDSNLSKPAVSFIRDSKVFTQGKPNRDDKNKQKQQLKTEEATFSPKESNQDDKILSGNLKTHSRSMEQPSFKEEKKSGSSKPSSSRNSSSSSISFDSNNSSNHSAVAKNRKPSSTRTQKVSPGVIHMMNPCPSGWMEGGLEEKPRPRSQANENKPLDSENQLFADQIKVDKDSYISSLDMDPKPNTISSTTDPSSDADIPFADDDPDSIVDKTETTPGDILTSAPKVELLCRRVWTHTKKPKTVEEGKHDNNDKDFTDAICMGPDETNFKYVYKGPGSSSDQSTSGNSSGINKPTECIESDGIISAKEEHNTDKQTISDVTVDKQDIANSVHDRVQSGNIDVDAQDASLNNEKKTSSQEPTHDDVDCKQVTQITAAKNVDHESMNQRSSLISEPSNKEKAVKLLPRQGEEIRSMDKAEHINTHGSLTSEPSKQEKTVNLMPRQGEESRSIDKSSVENQNSVSRYVKHSEIQCPSSQPTECEDSTDEDDESSGSSGTHTDSDSSQEIELASFEMPQQQAHLTTVANMSDNSYSDNTAHSKGNTWDGSDGKVDVYQGLKEPGNEVYAIDCSFEDVETYKVVKKKDEATDDVKNPILCECNFNSNNGQNYQVESSPCDTDLDYDFVSRYCEDFHDQNVEKVPEVIDDTPYTPLRSNLKCKFKSEPCLFDRRVHFQDNLPVYKSSESIRSKPYSGISPEDSEASKLEYMQKFIQCLFENEPKAPGSARKDRFLEPLPSFDDDNNAEHPSSQPQNLSAGSLITAMDIFKHTPDVHATADSSGEVLVSRSIEPNFALAPDRAYSQTAPNSNVEPITPSSIVPAQWSTDQHRLEPTASIDSTDSEPPPRPSLPVKYHPRIAKPVTGRAHKQEEEPHSTHADIESDIASVENQNMVSRYVSHSEIPCSDSQPTIDNMTLSSSLQVYTKPEDTMARDAPSPECKESLNQISTALSRISDENEQWQPIITHASIICEAELIPEAAKMSTYTTAHDVWGNAAPYGKEMNLSRNTDMIYWMNKGAKPVEESKRLSKSETDLDKSTRNSGAGKDGKLMRYTYTYNDDSDPDSPKIKSVTYEYVTEYKLNNVKVNYKQNRKVQTDHEPKRKGKTDSVEKFMVPRPKKMFDAKVQTSIDEQDSKAIPVEEIMERSVCYPLGPINNLPVTNSQEPHTNVEEGTVKRLSHKVYEKHDKKQSKSMFKTKQEGSNNKRPSHSSSWIKPNSSCEAHDSAIEKSEQGARSKTQPYMNRPYEHPLGRGYVNKKVIEHNSEKFVLQSFKVDPADPKWKVVGSKHASIPSNPDNEMKRNWTLLDEVDGDCEFEEYRPKKRSGESVVESVSEPADARVDKTDGKNLYSALMAEQLPDVQVDDSTNESIFLVQAMAVIALGTVLVFLLPYAG